MALIEKRNNKKGISYKITISTGYNTNGKQIRKCITYTPDPSLTPAKQKKAAEQFAADYEKKILSGNIIYRPKIVVSDYCNQWLMSQKNCLAPSTYNFYRNFITTKLIKQLGFYKIDAIKKTHIENFLDEIRYRDDGKEYSLNSRKKHLAILKSIFHTAWLDEIIDTNPTERIRLNKANGCKQEKYTPNCFSYEETVKFLDLLKNGITYTYKERSRKDKNGEIYSVKSYTSIHNIPTQFNLFYNIAIFGGLRKGEILGLTWNDINYSNNTITINKSVCYTNGKIFIKEPKTQKSNRTISLPVSLMQMIKEYNIEWMEQKKSFGLKWKGENYLFIQNDGALMHPSTPYHKFKEIIKQYNATCTSETAKLPLIRLHDLRHTCATLLIAENVDIAVVSERLGHSNISTTLDIYTHALKKADQTASEKLENNFFKTN